MLVTVLSLPIMAMIALWFHGLGMHVFGGLVWLAMFIILMRGCEIFSEGMCRENHRREHGRSGHHESNTNVIYIYKK